MDDQKPRTEYTDAQNAISASYPGLSARAKAGSRLAAVKLFCVECHGGNAASARDCETRGCFLWNVRGSWTRRAA